MSFLHARKLVHRDLKPVCAHDMTPLLLLFIVAVGADIATCTCTPTSAPCTRTAHYPHSLFSIPSRPHALVRSLARSVVLLRLTPFPRAHMRVRMRIQANVLVTDTGEAKICDFGLSRRLVEQPRSGAGSAATSPTQSRLDRYLYMYPPHSTPTTTNPHTHTFKHARTCTHTHARARTNAQTHRRTNAQTHTYSPARTRARTFAHPQCRLRLRHQCNLAQVEFAARFNHRIRLRQRRQQQQWDQQQWDQQQWEQSEKH